MDNETEERFKDVIYEIRMVHGLVIVNLVALTSILITGLILIWLK